MPNRTTRARTAGTTRRTRRRQVPPVNTISTARRNRKPTQDDIAGQIMWLPSPAEVICDTPLVLDEGCFNHPVLILSSCPDKHKHVRILIITSFHSTSLPDKHKRSSAVRKLYLPIHPAAPHADLDGKVLYLEGNRELLKKSYVSLAKKWSVPFKILRSYPYDYEQGGRTYKLTKESLKVVMGLIPHGREEEDEEEEEEGMGLVHSAASSCAAQVGTGAPKPAPKPAPALNAEVLMTSAARVREMAAGQAAPSRFYQAWGAQAASTSARPTVPRSSSATIPREAALAASAARYYSDNSRRPLLAAAANPSSASAAPTHAGLVNPLANWMDPTLRTTTSPATPNYGATLERLAQRQQQARPVDSIGLQRSATYPAPGSYCTRQQRTVNGYYYPSPGEARRLSVVAPAAEDGGPKWLQVVSVVVFIGFVVGVIWLLGYLSFLAWPFAKAAFGWLVGAFGWVLSHGGEFLVGVGQKLMGIWLKIWHWLIGKTVQGSGLQKGTVLLGRYNAMLRGD